MGRTKIAVVGAGNVGGSVANECMRLGLGDIVVVDVAEGIAAGKALDLLESTPVLGLDVNVVGTIDYALTRYSDLIIITAGSARKPGMSQDDLLAINARVVRTVTESVAPLSPEARIIVVTNPVDVLCSEVMAISGFSPERIVGLGGVLDTSRFRTFIARELGVSVLDVHSSSRATDTSGWRRDRQPAQVRQRLLCTGSSDRTNGGRRGQRPQAPSPCLCLRERPVRGEGPVPQRTSHPGRPRCGADCGAPL